MDELERVIASSGSDEDRQLEATLRPASFDEYVGQRHVLENLGVSVQAALQRGERLDHLLLHGLRDHADHVIAMLAVGRIGAVVLPLDWRARPQEKISLANRFETTLILVDEDAKPLEHAKAMAFGALARNEPVRDPARHFVRDPGLPFLINFSSGSTGSPKPVYLTHGQIFARYVAW